MKTVIYKDPATNTEVMFNADWAASKTEKEFVEHEKHHGLSTAQLKEAHKLCKQAVKPTEAEPQTEPAPTTE